MIYCTACIQNELRFSDALHDRCLDINNGASLISKNIYFRTLRNSILDIRYSIFDIRYSVGRYRGRVARLSSAKAPTAVRICSVPQKQSEKECGSEAPLSHSVSVFRKDA